MCDWRKLLPSSRFRTYLDNSMNQILSAGYSVTNDLQQIDTYQWSGYVGTLGDVNGDTQIDESDIGPFIGVLLGTNVEPLEMLRSDMDGDADADGDDLALFLSALVGP